MRALRKMTSTCVGGPPRTAAPTKTRKDKAQTRETKALERKGPPCAKDAKDGPRYRLFECRSCGENQDPHAKAGQGFR
jgi:hypothetical protein